MLPLVAFLALTFTTSFCLDYTEQAVNNTEAETTRELQRSLSKAASVGSLVDVQRVLAYGNRLDVNWREETVNHRGCLPETLTNATVLHRATAACHVPSSVVSQIVELLYKSGAQLDLKETFNGNTPLMLAASGGHLDTIRFLLENNADIHARNNLNWTALHWASWQGHYNTCELLLAQGSKTDERTKDNSTALYLAASKNWRKTALALLEHKADIEARGYFNSTPLMIAADRGHVGMARLLLDNMADLTSRNANKWTALHFAANNGQTSTVQFLLDRGADPTAKDINDQTPLMLATKKGFLDTAGVLKNHHCC